MRFAVLTTSYVPDSPRRDGVQTVIDGVNDVIDEVQTVIDGVSEVIDELQTVIDKASDVIDELQKAIDGASDVIDKVGEAISGIGGSSGPWEAPSAAIPRHRCRPQWRIDALGPEGRNRPTQRLRRPCLAEARAGR